MASTATATAPGKDKDKEEALPSLLPPIPHVPFEPPPRCRPGRAKRASGMEALEKLQHPENLSRDELARLRKEARMARNRASAERTRLRRLQYTADLETKVQALEAQNAALVKLLQNVLVSAPEGKRMRMDDATLALAKLAGVSIDHGGAVTALPAAASASASASDAAAAPAAASTSTSTSTTTSLGAGAAAA